MFQIEWNCVGCGSGESALLQTVLVMDLTSGQQLVFLWTRTSLAQMSLHTNTAEWWRCRNTAGTNASVFSTLYTSCLTVETAHFVVSWFTVRLSETWKHVWLIFHTEKSDFNSSPLGCYFPEILSSTFPHKCTVHLSICNINIVAINILIISKHHCMQVICLW